MSKIKLIIEIEKRTYELLKDKPDNIAESIIANGIPLPEGHGRLIDVDALREDFKTSKKITFAELMNISCIVDHAPTIVEADKENDNTPMVCGNDPRWCERCVSKGKCSSTRPKGDLISRVALKDQINATDFDFGDYYDNTEEIRERVCNAIDNAQAIPLPNEQVAWEQGFEAGLAQAVEITEEQAINKLHETGWLIGHDKEMTERPQGEWIKIDEEWYDYKCSVCGEKVRRLYPFCHCGADMRGGKE